MDIGKRVTGSVVDSRVVVALRTGNPVLVWPAFLLYRGGQDLLHHPQHRLRRADGYIDPELIKETDNRN